jgi:hypothetical protein
MYGSAVDPAPERRLDQVSQAFAEQLFARFPAWSTLASPDASGSITVDVPSPAGDPERRLRFWMERGEPSVAVGGWHTHAGLWPSRDAWFAFIEDILCDRTLFLVIPGHPASWSILEDPVEEEIADVLTDPSAPREVRVLSWSGSRDRIVRMSDLSI